MNQEIENITGIEVAERVPDSVLAVADEVVNIDLTADELITRLKQGKIYSQEKVAIALNNFFKSEHILQLRELALKEVALRVEKKVELEISKKSRVRHERFLACIDSTEKNPRRIIRKVARLSTRYNATFSVLYVRTPSEQNDNISLAAQRYLINNFKLATELGAEVIQHDAKTVIEGIIDICNTNQISTVCIGKPKIKLLKILFGSFRYRHLFNSLAKSNIDLIILS